LLHFAINSDSWLFLNDPFLCKSKGGKR